MGRKTYEQILSFGEFPSLEKECYVFSNHSSFEATPYARTVRSDMGLFVELRQTEGRNIWLVSGAALIQSFIEQALLNELVLSIRPVLLSDCMPCLAKQLLQPPSV